MENQSKNRNRMFKIPMIVTEETVHDFGIDASDVTWTRIGNRKCMVVMVDTTEEVFLTYMRPVWKDVKREDRESRCMIPGKGGKLIRCPESNKCTLCENPAAISKERNRPASISLLIGTDQEPVTQGSFEDDVTYKLLFEDLMALLTETNPMYGKIFQMLYDGCTQAEMEQQLGIPQRTISDRVKEIRSFVQPLVKDYFNR